MRIEVSAKIISFYRANKVICHICALGLLLRLVFILFFARYYFNSDTFYIGNDTDSWGMAAYYLIDRGEFTILPGVEASYYARMPGYTFFILPFYCIGYVYCKLVEIFGYHISPIDFWNVIYRFVSGVQVLMDIVNIFLVYKIAISLFKNRRIALVTALIYATYPFIIIWSPICYSELPSVFFALLAMYFLLKERSFKNVLWSGFFMGFSVLNRPQFALLAPMLVLLFLNYYKLFDRNFIKYAVVYFIGFGVIYGAWPLRNYIKFKKVILTQDLSGYDTWNVDVLSFMQYIYSVKEGWEPQFTQIIKNREVDIPREALISEKDSLMLVKAFYLSKNYGRGFSEWSGYWKETISRLDTANDKSSMIASLYKRLRENQIKHNPFNFYVKVPLANLRKALFKAELNASNSIVHRAASILFIYRSIMIILGVMSAVILLKNKDGKYIGIISLAFFVMLYLYLCAGTSPQCRNIEMRYLLPPDIILLFPAGYILSRLKIWDKIFKKESNFSTLGA